MTITVLGEKQGLSLNRKYKIPLLLALVALGLFFARVLPKRIFICMQIIIKRPIGILEDFSDTPGFSGAFLNGQKVKTRS